MNNEKTQEEEEKTFVWYELNQPNVAKPNVNQARRFLTTTYFSDQKKNFFPRFNNKK